MGDVLYFANLLAGSDHEWLATDVAPDEAVLRDTDRARFADLILDTGTRQASRGERVISLTAKEYELLELFMRHPRQVLTRDMIFDRVWGYDFGGESNIIEVYIRYLRSKLEIGERSRLIQTVRGVGYALREVT